MFAVSSVLRLINFIGVLSHDVHLLGSFGTTKLTKHVHYISLHQIPVPGRSGQSEKAVCTTLCPLSQHTSESRAESDPHSKGTWAFIDRNHNRPLEENQLNIFEFTTCSEIKCWSFASPQAGKLHILTTRHDALPLSPLLVLL